MKAKTPKPARRNPVARNAVRLLKAGTFRDRTKYRRQAKHKGLDPYPVAVAVSC